jgi:hypothetical protein
MKTPLPADEKRVHRCSVAIGLSVVMVLPIGLVLLGIYLLAGRPHPLHRLSQPPIWHAELGLACILALLAALVGLAIYAGRSARAARQESDIALSLFARGELVEAKARFEALAARRWATGFAELARYHLALVSMRLGDLDGARERFIQLQRTAALGGEGTVLSCIQIGVSLALAGDLPAAEAWLAEAEVRATHITTSRLNVDQQLLFARTLCDCRRGAAVEAARLLQSRWRELEASLSGEGIRPWRVLYAFSLASSSGPRECPPIDPLLAALRGGPSGELAWLGVRWPEMQSFLAVNSLEVSGRSR